MSGVIFQVSDVFFFDKGMELVDGGSVINGAYPACLVFSKVQNMAHCKLAHQSQSQNGATFTSPIWSLL